MKKSPALRYILLLGFILRVLAINQSFWLDEATSGVVARDYSFSYILQNFLPGDFHPPLYYLLLKIWGNIIGYGDIQLRLLSVVFGIGTIFVVYKIGVLLKNKQLGLLAAFLLAISPLHVYYSHEARMYAAATFFVSLVLYYFYLIILRKSNKFSALWLAFSLVLLLLTDYVPLLVVPALIFAAYTTKSKKVLLKLLPVFILFGFVFIAYFPILLSQLQQGLNINQSAPLWWNILGKTSLKNILLLPAKIMVGRVTLPNKIVYVMLVAAIGGIYGFLLLKTKNSKLKTLWFCLLIPLILGALIGLFVPILLYFRFIFILPALYLLLSSGLLKVKKELFVPVFAILVLSNLGMSVYYLRNEKFHREDWKSMVSFINSDPKAEKAIIFPADSQMEAVKYYWPDAPVIAGNTANLEKIESLWLVRYISEIVDPEDKVRKRIENEGYVKIGQHDFRGVIVWHYEK